MTPYYSHRGITIYHGNCEDMLPTLADGSFDIVLTDPPYEVGKAAWDALPKGALEHCYRITAGALLVFWSAFDLGRIPQEVGIQPKNTIVWWKPNLPALWMFDRSRLASQWEPIFYFAKEGFQPATRPTDVWAWNYPPNTKDRVHPTQKPVGLVTKLLTVFRGEAVLDPFLGSGTTLLAAKQLGMKAVGIEQNERFCEIAANRLSQEVMILD